MVIMTTAEAYEILEVTSTATESEVKTAYKKKALKTHPDKNPNDPKARENFQRVSEAYKRITDPDSFKDEDDGEMDFDDLNNMFSAMFADMMGGMGGMGGMDGLPFDMLEAMMMGGGFDMAFDEEEEGFIDEEGGDFMGMAEMHAMQQMLGGMGMAGGDYLDASDDSDEDDDDEAAAERAYMAAMMGAGRGGGKSGGARSSGRHGAGPDSMLQEMIMGGMMGGGTMEDMLGGMMGAAMMGGGADMEAMLGLMGGGPPPPRGKNRSKSNPNNKSKEVSSRSSANDEYEDSDEWETDSGGYNEEEEAEFERKKKKAAKNKAKKKNAKAKKSAAKNSTSSVDSMPQPQHSSEGVLRPHSAKDKDKDKDGDAAASEMASLLASMMGDLSGEKSSTSASSTSSSTSTAKAKNTQRGGNGSAGRGGASLSARLSSQNSTPAVSSMSEIKKSHAAEVVDGEECFLSVGDKVLVLNKHPGVVGYVGKVHYTKGLFVGVIVDSGAGKNNGTIKGHKYFTCERGQGLMVRAADVRPLSLSD